MNLKYEEELFRPLFLSLISNKESILNLSFSYRAVLNKIKFLLIYFQRELYPLIMFLGEGEGDKRKDGEGASVYFIVSETRRVCEFEGDV